MTVDDEGDLCWASIRRCMAASNIAATSGLAAPPSPAPAKSCSTDTWTVVRGGGGGALAQAGGLVVGDALGVATAEDHDAHHRPGPRRHTPAAGAAPSPPIAAAVRCRRVRLSTIRRRRRGGDALSRDPARPAWAGTAPCSSKLAALRHGRVNSIPQHTHRLIKDMI